MYRAIILLTVNYHVNQPRKHVSINTFMKKHVILKKKGSFHMGFPFPKIWKSIWTKTLTPMVPTQLVNIASILYIEIAVYT